MIPWWVLAVVVLLGATVAAGTYALGLTRGYTEGTTDGLLGGAQAAQTEHDNARRAQHDDH